MTEKIFDCLVLGSEPQGLWLLSQLDKRYSSVKADAHLGWLQMKAEVERVPVAEGLAPIFGIRNGEKCRLEVVTPSQCVEWTKASLGSRFPGLGELPSSLKPSSKQLAALRFVLRRSPEVLPMAAGVWRHFGRTPSLSPEMLLWASLMCTDLFWWDSTLELPASVERLGPSDPANIRIMAEPKLGLVRVRVADSREFSTRNLVLAPSVQEALLMPAAVLPNTLLGLRESLSALTEFPLTIEASPSHRFEVCAPLVTYLDTDEIADPDTEMWPMRFMGTGDKRVTAFVRTHRETSLDSVLESFRNALQRLCTIIPGFLEHTQSIWPPLQMDTCFADDSRKFVLEALQARSKPLHATTRWRTETDVKRVYWLGTNMNCSLPYPVGPLVAAQELVDRLTDRKRIKKAKQHLLHPL